MNTMLLKHWWLLAGLLLISVLIPPRLHAEPETDLLRQARACGEEPSRLERLHCYDAVFQVGEGTSNSVDMPALWYDIEQQEAAREEENVGLIVQVSGNDVLMSAPALGTTPPRPVLVMACEKLITRFQLHLPSPLTDARVDLRLSGEGGSVQQQWRVRDGGQVLSGGRGLPAIETLQQLLSANELTLRSDVGALDGLRFDVTGLRESIQPLRNACRW
ncbi:type VI secretion-associated protein [Halomonas sp. A020]|uniref:type VI secretion system-associated protein VasI n=1 Tax=Halomonas sp. A020 TaxID=2717374 RepID=UPI00248FBD5C|nr:type VI secretion system-associated protein VasI [Halomonas sp. A020]BCB59903.1 type VI secretion-associated protein [Halomonas sp. A020]